MTWLLVAYLSAQGADTATTVAALHRWPQAHERALFLPQQPPGIVAVKAAVSGATVFCAETLRRHHRDRLARFVYIAGAGIGFAAAAHNASLWHR